MCVCVFECFGFNPQCTNILLTSGDPLYDRPARKKNQSQEDPYSGLDLGTLRNQPVVMNEAFSMPDDNDGPNNISSTADENGGHGNNCDSSVYVELDEVAMRNSGLLNVCLY